MFVAGFGDQVQVIALYGVVRDAKSVTVAPFTVRETERLPDGFECAFFTQIRYVRQHSQGDVEWMFGLVRRSHAVRYRWLAAPLAPSTCPPPTPVPPPHRHRPPNLMPR